MSKPNPCANLRSTGCTGQIVQRGNIFCDECTELRKSLSKNRRENNIDELIVRNGEMEKELYKLRETLHSTSQRVQELEGRLDENNQSLENSKKTILDLQIQNAGLQESKKELEINYEQALNSKTISGYTDQLERECSYLKITIEKLRDENIAIVKERETYEMTHSQIRLDNETVMTEIGKLKSENQSLKAENKSLLEENKNLAAANITPPAIINPTPPVNPPKPIVQVGGAPTAVIGLKKPKIVQPAVKQRKR